MYLTKSTFTWYRAFIAGLVAQLSSRGIPAARSHAAHALWEMRERTQMVPLIVAAGGVKLLSALCMAKGKSAPPVDTLLPVIGIMWFLAMDGGAAREIAKSG